MQKAQHDAQLRQYEADRAHEAEMSRLQYENGWKKLEAETKVLVAQIAAEAGAKQAQISAETSLAQAQMQGQKDESVKAEKSEGEASTGDALAVAIQGFTAALEQMRQPKTIIRGPDGRVSGVQ